MYGSRDHIIEARFGGMLDAALARAGATSVLLELPMMGALLRRRLPYGIGSQMRWDVERLIAWAVNRWGYRSANQESRGWKENSSWSSDLLYSKLSAT